MDTKKLRQKILDLAIRGKLVPQDPNDEPASVLLERIRAEKEQLIKEGKIKRSKKSASTDKSHYENPPFEIPESWEWTTLVDVCEVARGGSPRPIKDYLTTDDDGVNWIKIGDTDKNGKYINSTKEKIKQEGIRRSRYVHKGDFLLTNSMSFGRPYILNIDGCIHDGWLVISPASDTYVTEFLYYLLSSSFAYEQFADAASGGVVSNLNSDKVASSYFPLPPLQEQYRIVKEIERWFALIDKIEQDKIDLQTDIKQTKSKILDLAIQGKLVPQDPNDEPAIELLKRINPNFVPCDNSHYENLLFEIPDSWELCKFGDFLDVRDGTHNSPRYLEKGYPLVTSKNLKNGDIDFDTAKFISTEDYINFSQRSFVEDGDILFAMIGSIGNPVLVKKCREFSIKNVALFKPYDKIHTNMKYVFYYLLYVQEKLKYEAKGGMQPFIPLNYFRKELYIPIPPYNEQERIVEKLSKIFEKIDSITAEL